MKILFTGASSFTGFWFVKTLASQGHELHTPLQKEYSQYEGIRKKRIDQLPSKIYFSTPFGSKPFFDLVHSQPTWDIFCHHAAYTENYKSKEFDWRKALQINTNNIELLIELLKQKNVKRIISTGTVFEPTEGGEILPASSYGLSKGLSWQVIQYYANLLNIKAAKFVIPNPFGPFEDVRFTSYLVKSWLTKTIPTIQTPNYIRDNIHIDLLAKCYAEFVDSSSQLAKPCGYIETQEAFAHRFAKEMSKRLNIPCPIKSQKQTDFSEPLKRVNSDLSTIKWDEKKSWDHLASYYQNHLGKDL
jgi:UDP-glucose 4-epimerase